MELREHQCEGAGSHRPAPNAQLPYMQWVTPPPGVLQYRAGVSCWRNWKHGSPPDRHGRAIITADTLEGLDRAERRWLCPVCGEGTQPPRVVES